MMFPVHFSARWREWVIGDDVKARRFGWLLLAVNGVTFKQTPMPPWPVETGTREPPASSITRALVRILGDLIP